MKQWLLVPMLTMLSLIQAPQAAHSASKCKATIKSKTGVIEVKALLDDTMPKWGTAAGQETATFFNETTCYDSAGGKLSKCTLGDPTTLSGITPPANCKVCVSDASATSCCAHIKGCIPAIRLRDASFTANDPRFEALEAPNTSTLRVSGLNLQIVDGSGDTAGTTNGKGNLIVGYNEATMAPSRVGSHNLVIGSEHAYSSYGGLVQGVQNTISGAYASVSGGSGNTASGNSASVSGGGGNVASAPYASVSGGAGNIASGQSASVTSGSTNTASGFASSITGGANSHATYDFTTVSGGYGNYANGFSSTVSGGATRTAGGDYDWWGGGSFQDF